MKILYIAHRIPYPPDKGDKIRSFHHIRYLASNHTVHLACLADERKDLQHVKTLKRYCASVDVVYRSRIVARCLGLLALFTKTSLSVASFHSRKLRSKITKRLATEKLDRILVSCSAMAEYVRHVSCIPKVIDLVDVDSEKWRLYAEYHRFPLSWIYRLEGERLHRYERDIARAFRHSIFVSEREGHLFRRQGDDQSISVIPNGVDLEYFMPNANEPYPNKPVIVFTGAMNYFPNVDAVRYFCEAIFPLVRIVVPEARFYIVGRNPTRQVKALGRQPNVTVTGSVPDVRPYLTKARVGIGPLRIARGIQNKILEAMAMGLPVVGTSQAFQGTQATAADGIRIADEPKGFAQEVVTLLKEDDLHCRCSLQARRYVERYHRWQDSGARVENLLQEVS